MTAREEAIGRLAKAAQGAAENWRWNRGEPGEITGTTWRDTRNLAYNRMFNRRTRAEKHHEYHKTMSPLLKAAQKQFRKSSMPEVREAAKNFYKTENALVVFSNLEQAGVPREWTGKVFQAVAKRRKKEFIDADMLLLHDDAKAISNAMRELNNNERSVFLDLFTNDATGAQPDKLAARARALTRANYRSI